MPEPTPEPASERATGHARRDGRGGPGTARPAAGSETAGTAGPGRLFTLLYGIFAVGATSRSVVQLATRAHEAPVAYGLSAFAAVVYVVGFVLLLRWGHPGSRRAMRVLCLVELTGVLVVGTLSLVRADLFPDSTVWSDFGIGYLFLPAVLPVLVLRWLARTGGDAPGTGGTGDRPDRR